MNKLNKLSLIVSVLAILIYIQTIAKGITYGDSGDLITASYTFGIPHPSGYPLYILLGRLFLFFPFIKDVAVKFNIMSALFSAFSLYFLTSIYLFFLKDYKVTFITSFIFGLSLTFWYHARLAEVYNIHIFFLSLIIYLLIKWYNESNIKYIYLTFFFTGLSFCNHLTTFLFFSIIFPFLLLKSNLLTKKRVILSFLFFILPLSLYFYLPLSAKYGNGILWGNPQNFKNFFHHVLGKDYHYQFISNFNEYFNNLKGYLRILVDQYTIIGIFFGLLGFLRFIKEPFNKFFPFFSLYIFTTFYPPLYNIDDIDAYYLPSNALFSLFIGLGLSYITNLLKRLPVKKIELIIFAFFLLIPTYLYLRNGAILKGSEISAIKYGEESLKVIKPFSLVLTAGDSQTFILWYYQFVVSKREDFEVVNIYMLGFDWYREYLKRRKPNLNFENISDWDNLEKVANKIIKNNIHQFSIYVVDIFNNKRFKASLEEEFIQIPVGPLYCINLRYKSGPNGI